MAFDAAVDRVIVGSGSGMPPVLPEQPALPPSPARRIRAPPTRGQPSQPAAPRSAICASAAGSSIVVRSPGSRCSADRRDRAPQQLARARLRQQGDECTRAGRPTAPSCASTSFMTSPSSLSAPRPGRRGDGSFSTAKAIATWPFSGSATPTTATSATPAWLEMLSSISACTQAVAGDVDHVVSPAEDGAIRSLAEQQRQHHASRSYRIWGYVHSLPSADPLSGLHGSRAMVPLTEVVLRYRRNGAAEREQLAGLIVNRGMVDRINQPSVDPDDEDLQLDAAYGIPPRPVRMPDSLDILMPETLPTVHQPDEKDASGKGRQPGT